MDVRSTIKQIPDVIRIWLSGEFDSEAYIAENPSVTHPVFLRTYHWVKHGHLAGYNPGGDLLSRWTLPKLLADEISAAQLRQLRKAYDAGTLEHRCASLGLSYEEFECLAAYENGQYDSAAAKLGDCSVLFKISLLHKSMRERPDFSNLPAEVSLIMESSRNGQALKHVQNLTRLRDLAFTAGLPWEQIAAMNKDIQARLKIVALPPVAAGGVLKADLTQSKLSPEKFKTYQILQSISAENATRTETFVALRKTEAGWDNVPADDESITVLLPDMGLWHQDRRAIQTIQAGFNRLVEDIGRTRSILPLPAIHGRCLTHAQWPGRKLLSYHTYAQNRDNILHWKEGSLSRHIFVDPKGYSGGSSLADPETKLFPSQTPRPSFDVESKYKQIAVDQPLPETGFIFIPLQVPRDSVAIWQDIPPLETLKIVAKHCADKGLGIVTKIHPMDKSEATLTAVKTLQKTYKNIHLSQNNLQAILSRSSLVIVSNSGVGFEALLSDKNVISTGRSEYLPGTIYAPTEEHLRSAIDTLLIDGASNKVLRDKFIDYYFQAHNLDLNDAKDSCREFQEWLTRK